MDDVPQVQIIKQGPSAVFLLIGGIFGTIGLGLLVGAFFLWKSQKDFLDRSQTVNGTVTGNAERRTTDTKTRRVSITYAPVVEFVSADGQARTFTSRTSSFPPSHQVGDTVSVIYDPAQPDTAEVNDFESLWMAPTIVGGLGLVFSPVGIGLLATGLPRKGQSKRQRR